MGKLPSINFFHNIFRIPLSEILETLLSANLYGFQLLIVKLIVGIKFTAQIFYDNFIVKQFLIIG